MKNIILLLAGLLIGTAILTSYATEIQGTVSLIPPENTVSKECPQQDTTKAIPFAKVMEPAFAEDYVDIDITTEVQFIATGKGAWYSDIINKYEKKKYITFRALPPGHVGEKNQLSGEVMSNFILIPKDKTDSIFSAKAGDILVIKGRPVIEKSGGFTSVYFIASSAIKNK